MCVYFQAISAMNRRKLVCCEFERELDPITENLGSRLTAILTREDGDEETRVEAKLCLNLKRMQFSINMIKMR